MKEMNRYYDSALGTLYGVAIGDAMGMPTTFMNRKQIKEKYGVVKEFKEAPLEGSVHSKMVKGQYTDDTELTFALARSIIHAGRVDPVEVAEEVLKWANERNVLNTTLIGPSTRKAIEGLKRGLSCTITGRSGTTNGCAMKITPVAIFDAFANEKRVINDVISACLPTHHTAVAVSGASAMCFAVRECIKGQREISSIVNASKRGADMGASSMGEPGKSISERISEAIAISAEPSFDAFLDRLCEFLIDPRGALTEDIVPAAVAIFAHSMGNFREAIIEGCNLGGDANTIASMAGGLAGAYSGYSLIPGEWISIIDAHSKDDIRWLARELVNEI